jgi:2-polyprenyl-6-methoxyphenol hydroxylase-like FAD-dependent oxidoreductase
MICSNSWSLACCKDKAAAAMMRLVDDIGRPSRRSGSATKLVSVFGYNIENCALMIALEAAASRLTRFDDSVMTWRRRVAIQRQRSSCRPRLVVGADGRQSLCRRPPIPSYAPQ